MSCLSIASVNMGRGAGNFCLTGPIKQNIEKFTKYWLIHNNFKHLFSKTIHSPFFWSCSCTGTRSPFCWIFSFDILSTMMVKILVGLVDWQPLAGPFLTESGDGGDPGLICWLSLLLAAPCWPLLTESDGEDAGWICPHPLLLAAPWWWRPWFDFLLSTSAGSPLMVETLVWFVVIHFCWQPLDGGDPGLICCHPLLLAAPWWWRPWFDSSSCHQFYTFS